MPPARLCPALLVTAISHCRAASCLLSLKSVFLSLRLVKNKQKMQSAGTLCFLFSQVGAKEGGRELFDDPSYVNVDKPRLQAAANGNVNRDAFDMSRFLLKSVLLTLMFFLLRVRLESRKALEKNKHFYCVAQSCQKPLWFPQTISLARQSKKSARNLFPFPV